MAKRLPSYRHHKGTGQAYTSHRGTCHYFGPYGSPESHTKYARFIAELSAHLAAAPAKISPGPHLSVMELVTLFWAHVENRYVKNGKPTEEQNAYKNSLAPVLELYGDVPAIDFGPVALETIKSKWITRRLARKTINRRIGRIVRCWKWAVSKQLIPTANWQALTTVESIRKGQGIDRPKVKSVPESRVDPIRPFVTRQVWAMIQFQLWTGCRPHEACQVRMADIDTSRKVWLYWPGSYKTQHREESERVIFIGPHCQALLAEWARKDPKELLWQPREARREWLEKNGAKKIPVGKHQAGYQYTSNTYGKAVERACELAFGMPQELRRLRHVKKSPENEAERKKAAEWREIHCWSPNQLRHTAGTRLKKEYGIELARIILGHTTAFTTEIYVDRDLEAAMKAMGESG